MPSGAALDAGLNLLLIGDVVYDDFAGGGEKQLTGHIAGEAAQAVGTASQHEQIHMLFGDKRQNTLMGLAGAMDC